MADLITGPVKETAPPKPAYVPPVRDIEIYKGEPPQNTDGKIPMVFTLQKSCNLEARDKAGKKFTCNTKLQVVRVKNTKFAWDETHTGGLLEYDEKDIHQYVRCPLHGPPVEALPSRW